MIVAQSDGAFFRSIRSIRILRPLRAIQRSRGMRLTVAALIASVPAIMTVAGCVIFFCAVTAILLVQLFMGSMHYCTDTTRDLRLECIGSGLIENEAGGEWGIASSIWQNHPTNFDNFGSAMLALFELLTLEAWPDSLFALSDATDPDHGPKRDNQQGLVTFLFFILLTIGTFFLMNLFVGVIVTAYNEAQQIDPPVSVMTRYSLSLSLSYRCWCSSHRSTTRT